jgi:hypothetical protein
MKRFNCLSQVALLVVCLTPLILGQSAAAKDSNKIANHIPAAINLTGQELNTLVSQESTQNVVTYYTTQLGAPLSGTWNGIVTDQGWTLTFSGSINGQTAAISESGLLKGNVASWTDSGTVGSINVAGSGTASLIKNKNEIKWHQRVGTKGDSIIEWVIVCVQVVVCVGAPELCGEVVEISEWLLSGKADLAVTQYNRKTGTLFGSNVQQESQKLTTVEEGSITLQTGAISYDSDSFTPKGSGDSR